MTSFDSPLVIKDDGFVLLIWEIYANFGGDSDVRRENGSRAFFPLSRGNWCTDEGGNTSGATGSYFKSFQEFCRQFDAGVIAG